MCVCKCACVHACVCRDSRKPSCSFFDSVSLSVLWWKTWAYPSGATRRWGREADTEEEQACLESYVTPNASQGKRQWPRSTSNSRTGSNSAFDIPAGEMNLWGCLVFFIEFCLCAFYSWICKFLYEYFVYCVGFVSTTQILVISWVDWIENERNNLFWDIY